VGKQICVDKLKKHPLARAMRIDKIRLAGLVATLLHYFKDEALDKIPVWQMISMPLEDIESRAQEWCHRIGTTATVVEGESTVGGGSLPGDTLPSRLLAIRAEPRMVQSIADNLRRQSPPVIGRIVKNTLLLDPRTVSIMEEEPMLMALRESLRACSLLHE